MRKRVESAATAEEPVEGAKGAAKGAALRHGGARTLQEGKDTAE